MATNSTVHVPTPPIPVDDERQYPLLSDPKSGRVVEFPNVANDQCNVQLLGDASSAQLRAYLQFFTLTSTKYNADVLMSVLYYQILAVIAATNEIIADGMELADSLPAVDLAFSVASKQLYEQVRIGLQTACGHHVNVNLALINDVRNLLDDWKWDVDTGAPLPGQDAQREAVLDFLRSEVVSDSTGPKPEAHDLALMTLAHESGIPDPVAGSRDRKSLYAQKLRALLAYLPVPKDGSKLTMAETILKQICTGLGQRRTKVAPTEDRLTDREPHSAPIDKNLLFLEFFNSTSVAAVMKRLHAGIEVYVQAVRLRFASNAYLQSLIEPKQGETVAQQILRFADSQVRISGFVWNKSGQPAANASVAGGAAPRSTPSPASLSILFFARVLATLDAELFSVGKEAKKLLVHKLSTGTGYTAYTLCMRAALCRWSTNLCEAGRKLSALAEAWPQMQAWLGNVLLNCAVLVVDESRCVNRNRMGLLAGINGLHPDKDVAHPHLPICDLYVQKSAAGAAPPAPPADGAPWLLNVGHIRFMTISSELILQSSGPFPLAVHPMTYGPKYWFGTFASLEPYVNARVAASLALLDTDAAIQTMVDERIAKRKQLTPTAAGLAPEALRTQVTREVTAERTADKEVYERAKAFLASLNRHLPLQTGEASAEGYEQVTTVTYAAHDVETAMPGQVEHMLNENKKKLQQQQQQKKKPEPTKPVEAAAPPPPPQDSEEGLYGDLADADLMNFGDEMPSEELPPPAQPPKEDTIVSATVPPPVRAAIDSTTPTKKPKKTTPVEPAAPVPTSDSNTSSSSSPTVPMAEQPTTPAPKKPKTKKPAAEAAPATPAPAAPKKPKPAAAAPPSKKRKQPAPAEVIEVEPAVPAAAPPPAKKAKKQESTAAAAASTVVPAPAKKPKAASAKKTPAAEPAADAAPAAPKKKRPASAGGGKKKSPLNTTNLFENVFRSTSSKTVGGAVDNLILQLVPATEEPIVRRTIKDFMGVINHFAQNATDANSWQVVAKAVGDAYKLCDLRAAIGYMPSDDGKPEAEPEHASVTAVASAEQPDAMAVEEPETAPVAVPEPAAAAVAAAEEEGEEEDASYAEGKEEEHEQDDDEAEEAGSDQDE